MNPNVEHSPLLSTPLFTEFLLMAILTGVRYYVKAILICMTLAIVGQAILLCESCVFGSWLIYCWQCHPLGI